MKRFFFIIMLCCISLNRFTLPASAEEKLVWNFDQGVLTIRGSGEMNLDETASWMTHKDQIESVVIEPGITSVAESAFDGCRKLHRVSLPDGITAIGDRAFAGCYILEDITLPDGVTSIGSEAFMLCKSMTTLSIPETVTSLGDGAFFECEKLVKINLPSGITEIPAQLFSGCEKLENVTIPRSVTAIGDQAFYFCRGFTHITIPEGVTSIGKLAFGQCTGITELVIPDSVTTIGEMAFNACRSVQDFHIPNGLTVIPNGAFGLCESAVTFHIPNSVTTIEDNAFAQCSNLSYIAIPASVRQIGSYAFGSSYRLNRIYFTGDAPTAGQGAFGYKLNEYVDGTITTTAYYPAENETWTSEARAAFGGNSTWVCCVGIPFADVPNGSWYQDAVLWAGNSGITTGVSATHFHPDETCSRGQIVTFLWRAAGKPKPVGNQNPFEDVLKDNYFFQAVLWAVENGITEGIDATHFSPNTPCTREQAVTFLYRYAGEPGLSVSENPFVDVTDGYSHDAVLWAAENHVTNGIDAAHFAPYDTCTRAQIIAFLYRFCE